MSGPRSGVLIAAAAMLAGQAIFVHWAEARERPPEAPSFSAMPGRIGAWSQTVEIPVEPEVANELRADRLLNRMYVNSSSGAAGNLFIAWFRSQRGGAQPHSPKVCLPGSGWITESSSGITLAGGVAANRMIVKHGPERAAVVYWYQNARRSMASEFASKLWVIADSVRDRRTDLALVRIVVWENGGDGATEAQAEALGAGVYSAFGGLIEQ